MPSYTMPTVGVGSDGRPCSRLGCEQTAPAGGRRPSEDPRRCDSRRHALFVRSRRARGRAPSPSATALTGGASPASTRRIMVQLPDTLLDAVRERLRSGLAEIADGGAATTEESTGRAVYQLRNTTQPP